MEVASTGRPITAPMLLAMGEGVPLRCGPFSCFYCGAACDGSFPRKDWVRDTFNDWRLVAQPESGFICAGCVTAVDEKWIVSGREKPQKRRNYSWILATNSAQSFDKSRIEALRDACLNPPETPFVIVLAVSGQKQLLFRAPVNWDRETIVVQLEDQRVSYRPQQLRDRLELCGKLVAATGKPALADSINTGFIFRVHEHHGDAAFSLLDNWQAVRGEPLSMLCLFLCPNKEACQSVYPSSTPVATA